MTFRRSAHRLAATAVSALALTLSGVAGLTPVGAAPTTHQTTNQDKGSLVVYNDNVENMLPASCEGNDFEKLFTYIKAQPNSPDLFTVNQIPTQAKLDALTERMSKELGVKYAGVIALPNPGDPPKTPKEKADPCYKDQQTNAVIYRTGRFTQGATITWRSDAPAGYKKDEHNGPCRNLTASKFQERVENVAVRLTDKLTGKTLTVASIHWPTAGPWNGPDCAGENIDEAQERTLSLGKVDLTILGGDTNARVGDGKPHWGDRARAFGFQDPYDFRDAPCKKGTCAPATWKKRRIDFLIAKGGHGFADPVTISRAAAGGKYSDHLAVRANIKY